MSEAGSAAGELVLKGGNMGGAVRVGGSVRRRADVWSPTVQRLLAHLRVHGIGWAPEPLGRDESGRDKVSFLPGVVPQYPLPEWVWAESVLISSGRHLAQFHDASVSFDRTGATWQLPVHEPAEVICHNDFAPYNMVFTDGQLTGVIDWDTASPGPRAWDLAYLAYRLVPLHDPNDETSGITDLAALALRLRLLCDSYGADIGPAEILEVVPGRLRELAAFTEARAAAGHDDLSAHASLYRRDAAWVTAQVSRLR